MAEGAGAKDKTHFYPMAMATHNIFPPPQTVGGEFGEERRVQWTHLGIAIGDELVAGDPTGLSKPEIKKLRIANTQAAFDAMMEGYKAIGGYDQ